MNRLIFKTALIIIVSLAMVACEKKKESSITGPGDDGTDEYSLYVQELDQLIHPLDGASPELNHDDLQPLSYLSNSRMVGLGEATHGTKEFFQLKHRIFRFLVENYNFKIFGFECDQGESIYIDRYICTGEGNIDELMRNIMHFWTWKTEEVKALFEWMKTFNAGKSEAEKIHFVGFDCQFMTYQPDLLLDYFRQVKPKFIEEINPTLNLIKVMDNSSPASVRDYYSSMNENQKQAISDSLRKMLTKVNNIESELVSKSSHFEYQYMRQLIRNMQQANDILYGMMHNDNTNYRDKYMAENAVWLSTLLGENTKIALWAHNGHVAKNLYYGGNASMGYYIKAELDHQYQIVGFSFSKGAFNAVTQTAPETYKGLNRQTININPPKGSINHLFSKAKYDNFIFKITDIPPDSELEKWISTKRTFLTIGAAFNNEPEDYYMKVYLKNYFDVVIHYDRTSASVLFNQTFLKGAFNDKVSL